MPAWPTVTDDTGDKISGTIFNKALTDAMKAYLDGLVVSGANPGVSAADIIDEVVDARGSKASLDARLDVALNEDGTPKAVAGQATESQVSSQQGLNLIRNGDMEQWNDGVAAAPNRWVLSGAGAVIAQAGPLMGDTTDLGTGTYCAKITSGGGAAARLTYQVVLSSEIAAVRNLRTRKVQFLMRGKASAANVLRIVVDDGVATTASAYHAGDGNEANLVVTHTIVGGATKLDVYAEVALGGNIAFVGGGTAVFSDVAMTVWPPPVPPPSVERRAGVVTGTLGNVGAGEDIIATFTIPAGVLRGTGDVIKAIFWGTSANTAAAKTLRARIIEGANNTLIVSSAVAINEAGRWVMGIVAMRTSPTAGIGSGSISCGPANAQTTASMNNTGVAITATWANAVEVRVTGEATNNNDLTCSGGVINVVTV